MITNIDDLKNSIFEAERFLERARACLADIIAVKKINSARRLEEPLVSYDVRKTAAVRRASMDLTRALARLRKTS